MSLKDLILRASDLPVESINVPEWDAVVSLKAMSGTVREQWFAAWDKYKADNALADDAESSHFHSVALVHALCDEHGTLLFNMADVPSLRGKSPHVLRRLYDVLRKQNKLGDEGVEGERKNS